MVLRDAGASKNVHFGSLYICHICVCSVRLGRLATMGKNDSQNFNGCPTLSQAIGQEKLRTRAWFDGQMAINGDFGHICSTLLTDFIAEN